jgi:hypothetical protein
MLVSMTVRCDQCGHESDPRYRFCGMCGAKLPPPPPPPEPVAAKPVREEPMRRVSGPSFLGLADEPASSVTYLLEDEMSESHWGRSLVLLIILGALGAAGWHWRSEVRAYVVARLAQHPNNNSQPEQTSSGGAVSTSASETALQTPNASAPIENQNAATNQTPATPAAAGQQPPAPPSNTAVSGEQNAAPAPAPAGQNSPAATSGTTQEPAGTAPAATSAKQEPKAAAEPATANEQAPKAEAATTKRAKSSVKETAAGNSGADQLEAEGEKYLYGTGVYANCSRAQKDLQAAAEQGSSKADSVMGTMYATGHCVSRDLPLAYRWFAMALQRDPGNTRLQRDLQVLWNQMTADERQIAMRR